MKKVKPKPATKKVLGGVSVPKKLSLFGHLIPKFYGCGCPKATTKLCPQHSRL